MIIEQRTYRFKAGKIPTFMAIYQKNGLPIQERILGNLIGYFITEIGPLNETVHLWGYDTLNDRNERRANLGSNEEWMTFLNEILPILESQECKILVPTSFSPIR